MAPRPGVATDTREGSNPARTSEAGPSVDRATSAPASLGEALADRALTNSSRGPVFRRDHVFTPPDDPFTNPDDLFTRHERVFTTNNRPFTLPERVSTKNNRPFTRYDRAGRVPEGRFTLSGRPWTHPEPAGVQASGAGAPLPALTASGRTVNPPDPALVLRVSRGRGRQTPRD